MLKRFLPTWLRGNGVGEETGPAVDYRLDVGLLTDVGCVRQQNEDCILYCKPADRAVFEAKGILAVVADGMGGHQAGEVASQTAVKTIRLGYFSAPMARNRTCSASKALADAFLRANEAVYRLSRQQERYRGMGTTASALVVKGNFAHYAHIGDSRIYRIRDRECQRLSSDHTVVNEMLEHGLIDATEAKNHPNRNILTRALGTHPDVAVDTGTEPLALRLGDRFLLSSDGLHELVRDDELVQAVCSLEPQQACDVLIGKARERGGHDNISVIVIRVQPLEGLTDIPITRV